MKNRPGVHVNGPVEICMVAGCDRRAYYHRVKTKSGRGYCRTHQHFAVEDETSQAVLGEALLNKIERRDDRPWRLTATIDGLAVTDAYEPPPVPAPKRRRVYEVMITPGGKSI